MGYNKFPVNPFCSLKLISTMVETTVSTPLTNHFCGRISSTNETSWIGELVSCNHTSGIHLATITQRGGYRWEETGWADRTTEKKNRWKGGREVWNSASSGSQRRTNFHVKSHIARYFRNEGHPIKTRKRVYLAFCTRDTISVQTVLGR